MSVVDCAADTRKQYFRPWKQIKYITNRVYHELRHNLGMIDLDQPKGASYAAFERVCCYIDYAYPRSKRMMAKSKPLLI